MSDAKKSAGLAKVLALVKKLDGDKKGFSKSDFNEHDTRLVFIDQFFRALYVRGRGRCASPRWANTASKKTLQRLRYASYVFNVGRAPTLMARKPGK